MSTDISNTAESISTEDGLLAWQEHSGTPGGYSDRQLGLWLVGAGLIALISSAILVYERLQIYIDAGHSTVCDLNALLSCGTVMRTPQAEAFGFPNPFIGLVGFAIVGTIGALIMAGAQFKKWFWISLNVGLGAAAAFIMWMWFETTFHINALCLFCMIVWVMTITLFVKTTIRNISAGVIPASPAVHESARGWSWFAIGLWLILIFGIIAIRFFTVIMGLMGN